MSQCEHSGMAGMHKIAILFDWVFHSEHGKYLHLRATSRTECSGCAHYTELCPSLNTPWLQVGKIASTLDPLCITQEFYLSSSQRTLWVRSFSFPGSTPECSLGWALSWWQHATQVTPKWPTPQAVHWGLTRWAPSKLSEHTEAERGRPREAKRTHPLILTWE